MVIIATVTIMIHLSSIGGGLNAALFFQTIQGGVNG